METIINSLQEIASTFNQLGGDGVLTIIMVVAGYLATDRAKIHKCGLFPFLDKVHWVFVVSAIIGAIYILTGTNWKVVLISYLIANVAYSHFVKKALSYLPNQKSNI